ncbi:MAG TPA: hypothetical protein VFA74_00050 [Terriglobales bacterium]|nr:hypothetical protein [Terriglobales bacterium]
MKVAGLLTRSRIRICFLLLFFSSLAVGQQAGLPDTPQPLNQPKQTDPENNGQRHKPSPNHIFWIIPNYRADESSAEFKPLTPHAKLKVAIDDSFDPSAFLVAGVFAGMSLAQRQYPGFGHGASAVGKYYGAAFADQAIGNMMTEALFPIAFRQDPRYFVKSKGGFWNRTGYAISREAITRGDDGRNHFNTSELGGNAVAAGISTLYYPASDRSAGNTVNKWGQQIGLDAFFNIMKEFWPDVRTKLFGQ